MREFLLAVLAGVVATAVYKTYLDKQATETPLTPGVRGPVIGASTLTRLPVFQGVASEAGHGDAILNANPSIAYHPAFGPDANLSASEWVGAASPVGSQPYKQYA